LLCWGVNQARFPLQQQLTTLLLPEAEAEAVALAVLAVLVVTEPEPLILLLLPLLTQLPLVLLELLEVI
jgi:hypothetical protein